MRYRTLIHKIFSVPSFSDAFENVYYRIVQWLFPRNIPTLFIRSIGRTIIDRYDGYQGQGAKGNTGYLGLGLVHYALVTALKPKRILCIGSKKGYIPIILALACKETGVGHVDFVDAGYGKNDTLHHWGGVGIWKNIDPKKYFSFLDSGTRITLYVMSTHEFIKKYNHRYQYIYVDGDHSYQGVKDDFNFTWSRLDPGGVMLFHDVKPKRMLGQPTYGVWKFWQELRTSSRISLTNVGTGLGMLQKMR